MNKKINYFYFDEQLDYAKVSPYMPGKIYPEYPFADILGKDENNKIYDVIRNIFIENKFDESNIGKKNWNPLGEYIQPGNTVLIKPNLVNHCNPTERDPKRGLECMITHPSVTRCVFDYVYIALKGYGTIIVADAPVQGCDFEKLLKLSGYGILFHYMESKATDSLVIKTGDLRSTVYTKGEDYAEQTSNLFQCYESKIVDLKNNSYFAAVPNKKRLRVTCYAAEETVSHHLHGKNEYCISEALLRSDVIINLPKPKTHRIAGYTAALKNMIGINARKEYLPHHRKGRKYKNRGDEYINTHFILKWLNSTGNDIKNWGLLHHNIFVQKQANAFSRTIGRYLDKQESNRKKFGMWYGNDTIWRTILDINRIVYYCDKQGVLREEKQRKVLHIGDMVVSGDKEGPLTPSYKRIGGLLFSDNPLTFDLCVVKLMGFDYRKFPVLKNALSDSILCMEDTAIIDLKSNDARFECNNLEDIEATFHFEPPSGWKEILL